MSGWSLPVKKLCRVVIGAIGKMIGLAASPVVLGLDIRAELPCTKLCLVLPRALSKMIGLAN